jgi:hypothetical protein
MHVFTEESESSRPALSRKPAEPEQSRLNPRLDPNSLHRFQRTIGNQAVLRLMEQENSAGGAATPSLSYGLDRMAMHGSRRGTGPAPIQRNSSAARTSGQAVTNGPLLGVQRDEEVKKPDPKSAAAATAQPAATTAGPQPATTSAQPASATPAAGKEAVHNAPSATYIIPFDHSPLAAPGERVIFRSELTDPSPGDFKLEYSTTGGHFDSASGGTSKTIAGLSSGNVDFFVPKPWDGTATVQVVLKVKKTSDSSVVQTETWNFALKAHVPTTITQKEGSGEINLPGVYSYDLGPALATGHKPFYEHQTILERFSAQTLGNIGPADIKPAYRTAHSLDTAAKVSQHFVDSGSGGNGTFTIDANDQIFDKHDGHSDLTNLVANLTAPKDIEVVLPQTYEATPGTALGNFKITRVLKADGTTWKVKKAKT